MATVYLMLTKILRLWSVLERDIEKSLDWFKNNSLQANPSEFQSMFFKSKTINAEDFNINVDNHTGDMTILCLKIYSKLNFNSHVSSMCNTAGRQLSFATTYGSLRLRESVIGYLYIKVLLCQMLSIVPWCGCLQINRHCQNSILLKNGPLGLCSMTMHLIIMFH